jgi:beta-phosphoglucomutase-like phosphatase (HAD superfamily)
VERLLDEAREAGIRLAIATTTTGDNIKALLDSTLGPDAMSWFEVIASADEVPDKKPSPAVYVYTLERLGLRARECVAFEDSENGIVAATRAGIPTVITVNDYTRGGDYRDAALVLDHLGEPHAPCKVLGGRAADRLPRPFWYVNVAVLGRLTADD